MLDSPTFWVFVSFAIFVAAFWRRLSRLAFGWLDARSARIRADLETAERLLAEAEALHAEQVARAEHADVEIAEILAEGRRQADAVRTRTDTDIAARAGATAAR